MKELLSVTLNSEKEKIQENLNMVDDALSTIRKIQDIESEILMKVSEIKILKLRLYDNPFIQDKSIIEDLLIDEVALIEEFMKEDEEDVVPKTEAIEILGNVISNLNSLDIEVTNKDLIQLILSTKAAMSTPKVLEIIEPKFYGDDEFMFIEEEPIEGIDDESVIWCTTTEEVEGESYTEGEIEDKISNTFTVENIITEEELEEFPNRGGLVYIGDIVSKETVDEIIEEQENKLDAEKAIDASLDDAVEELETKELNNKTYNRRDTRRGSRRDTGRRPNRPKKEVN